MDEVQLPHGNEEDDDEEDAGIGSGTAPTWISARSTTPAWRKASRASARTTARVSLRPRATDDRVTVYRVSVYRVTVYRATTYRNSRASD